MAKVTNKAKILTRYPDAVAEQQDTGEWAVFDISVSMTHGVRWHGDVARGRILLGLGFGSESTAWADAVRNAGLPK